MSMPNTIEELHRAARAAMRSGELRDAHRYCLAILEQDPKYADAWFMCGVIASANDQATKAVEIFDRALALEADNSEYLAEMAKALTALNRFPEALTTARQALDKKPTVIPTLATLGTVFSHAGSHELALCSYERAVKLLQEKGEDRGGLTAQWCAELYYNFGTSLEFAGRSREAMRALERAIEFQPFFHRAHFALSQLQRATPDQNHLARLRSLQEKTVGSIDRLHLGHALAKELEDLGNFAESLAALRWAKADRARQVGYRPVQDSLLFDCLESVFSRSFFQNHATGCDSAEPIFVVGMPRTGTTLVERILGSHSSVYAAGELRNFPLLVKRMTATASPEVLDAATLEASRQLDMAELGDHYLASSRPGTGHNLHFIDKLPLNFMYLGLIHLALPNAKLVCLRRDPMDTCLSNYRQLFATHFKYYYYSYDLLDCGRYYLRFDSLMRHWHNVMPAVVHEVQYEELVANPERVSRELVAFCELPWEPQCLEFHTHRGSVATPSATQVRQPIYRSSVDRWRQYGEAIQPLYELLTLAGCYR